MGTSINKALLTADALKVGHLAEAAKMIGTAEIKGPKHNPIVVQFFKDVKMGGIKDDETPWCGSFAGAMLKLAYPSISLPTNPLLALNYAAPFGVSVNKAAPPLGAVVTRKRTGGGHVAFIVGVTARGDYVCLGGNQQDTVSFMVIAKADVYDIRWPSGVPVPSGKLPTLSLASGDVSMS